jgi:hypothetical protein
MRSIANTVVVHDICILNTDLKEDSFLGVHVPRSIAANSIYIIDCALKKVAKMS